jgi:hypothetical protein
MDNLNQTQINALYETLLEKIQAKYSPINVVIEPDPQATISNCFQNVARKVLNAGGSVIYGWALLPQRHILEAEKHAIWLSPEGKYIDITPRPLNIPMLQFVIDDEFLYQGQVVGNVRLNTTSNSVVDDWIFVCEAIDELYTYSRRIDDERISVPEPVAAALPPLETLVKFYEPFVTSGGNIFTRCFCGSGVSYQDCHEFEVKRAIPKYLNTVKNICKRA